MIGDFDTIPELPAIYGPVKQLAYIVDDIDTAIKHWHEQCEVGPFLVTRNQAPLANAYYRGVKAETARINIAFAYVGGIQLELIELIGDTPSLYKEALDRQQRSVHHYAVCVEDFPSAYNYALDNGFTALTDAGVDGLARMSYVENDSGLILEIIEWNTITKPYFVELERRVAEAGSQQLVHEFNLPDITPKGAIALSLFKFMLKKLTGQVQQTRRSGNS